jgi:CRP-like cAMP-binding protein
VFAAIDVPPELADLHAFLLGLAQDVYAPLQALGEARGFGPKVNILHEAEPGLLMIDDGYCRLSHSGRSVRFLCDGELVYIASERPAHTSLSSELTTRTNWISQERFARALAADPGLMQRWHSYQDVQLQLMTSICAQYALDDQQLGMKLRNAAGGEVLIREGEQLREVLVLISGSATVMVDDIPVGAVAAGEFIGEMSFLSETRCGATVVANEQCVLQVIDRESFATVIRSRPNTMVVLARTLAERLVRANRLSAEGAAARLARPLTVHPPAAIGSADSREGKR